MNLIHSTMKNLEKHLRINADSLENYHPATLPELSNFRDILQLVKNFNFLKRNLFYLYLY